MSSNHNLSQSIFSLQRNFGEFMLTFPIPNSLRCSASLPYISLKTILYISIITVNKSFQATRKLFTHPLDINVTGIPFHFISIRFPSTRLRLNTMYPPGKKHRLLFSSHHQIYLNCVLPPLGHALFSSRPAPTQHHTNTPVRGSKSSRLNSSSAPLAQAVR